MTRFTLRDVFWLTLVVGMGVGWWMHVRAEARRHKAEKFRLQIRHAAEVLDKEFRFADLEGRESNLQVDER